MALPAADDFERAGPAIGSNWTFTGGGTDIIIYSSSDAGASNSGTQEAYWNADTFANDQWAEAIISASGGEPGVNVRDNTSGTYSRYGYYTQGSGGYNEIEKVVAGSWTQLTGGTSPAPAVGDRIRLTAVGTALKCYVNGVQSGSTTDSSLASGKPGFGYWDSSGNAKIERWWGGNTPAIEFVSAATAVNGAVTKPTGTASGDVLIAMALDFANGTHTDPSGWTRILSTSNGQRMTTWYRVAGGSEGSSYNLHATIGGSTAYAIACYRGVDGTTPVASSTQANGNGTTATMASITPTRVDQLLVACIGTSGDDIGTRTGWQLRASEDGGDCEIQDTAPYPVSAQTPTFTWGGTQDWRIHGIVLNPTGAGGGGGTTLNVSIGGTLTPAGALVKQDQKRLAGTLTLAGVLTKQDRRSLGGTLTMSGALRKTTNRSLAGTLTSSGAIAATRVKVLALAGTLTMAGALTKQGQRRLAGTLTSAGAISRKVNKGLAGALALAGALQKQGRRALSGGFTPTGSVGSVIPGDLPLRDDFATTFDAFWTETDTQSVLAVADARAVFAYTNAVDVWNDPRLVTDDALPRADLAGFTALVRLTNQMDIGKGFKLSLSPSQSDPDAAGSGSITVEYPDLTVPSMDEPASDRRQRSKDLLLTVVKRASGGWMQLVSEGKSGGEWPVFPDAAVIGLSSSETDATLYAHLAARRGRALVDYAAVLADASMPAAMATRFGAALVSETSGTRTAGTSSITDAGTAPRIIEATLTRGANNDTRAVVCFRGSSTSYANCWKFKGEFDRVSLHDTAGVVPGGQTGAVTVAAGVPTHLRVVDFGNRIDCYVNGTRWITVNSTTGATNTFVGTACDTGASLSVTVSEFSAWKNVTLNSDFGPFPTVPDKVGSATFTDAMTGTNGTALATHNAAWTVHSGAFEINSNKARITTAATNGIATVETGNVNHYGQAVIGMPADAWTYPDDAFPAVVCRYVDGSNFIQARLLWQDGPSPEVEVWQYVAGAGTLIAYVNLTGTIVSAGDYTLKVVARGAEVSAYLNGEVVAQGTTTLLTGTRAGIGVFDTNRQGQPTWDDFESGLSVPALSLAGTLTTAGALIKRVARTLVGALTGSGTVTKQTSRALSGTLASAGALRKQTNRAVTGSLTLSGSVGSSITPGGGGGTLTVTRSGTLTTAGSVVKRVVLFLGGVLSNAGALIQRPSRRVTGGLTPTGALTAGRVLHVSRGGTLTTSGSLTTHLVRGSGVSGTLMLGGTLDTLIIRQPQIPPPEFGSVSEASPIEAPLVGGSGPIEAGLVADDGPPEFIPRS